MWLQNIDSRDFACKFFGMKNLRATKVDPYASLRDDNKKNKGKSKQRQKQTKAGQKQKGCASRSLVSLLSIFC
jgi:hypothetical protein